MCSGSDASAPGLGFRLGSASKPDHAPQQGRVERFTARGGVRMRNVFGRREPGPEDGQAGGEQAESALRTDAGHLRVRHQHDRGQRPKTLRVSNLQEAAADGPQVRGLDRLRDGQQPEALDA